jgi:hypothetical protein
VEVPARALVALFDRPEVLPFLVEQGCAISMGLLDLSPERARVVRRLERETESWAREQGLRLHRVGLDIEPPRSDAVTLTVAPIRTLWPLVRRRRSREQVRVAERAYAALAREIGASGRGVETYHFPQLLDERVAGSTLLRRTLGLVDVSADVEVHMLYASYLGRAGARAYFAEAPAVAIGVTGGGVHAEESERLGRFLPSDVLDEELRAAAAHTSDVYVFSLEGCVARDQLDRIAAVRWEEPAPPLPGSERYRARLLRVALQTFLRTERLFDRFLPV